MGDEGLDKWHQRMVSHKRRGDPIIKYAESNVDKYLDENKRKLLLKSRRISFWEKYHYLPSMKNFPWWKKR